MSYDKKSEQNDEFMTSKELLEKAYLLIPNNLKSELIWEPFPGNGQSSNFFRKKNKIVTNGNFENFFLENKKQSNLLITNPPFSKKWEVLFRLCELKPETMIILFPMFSLTAEKMKFILKIYDIDLISMRIYSTFFLNGEPKKFSKPMLWVRFKLREKISVIENNHIFCKFFMDQDFLKLYKKVEKKDNHIYSVDLIFKPILNILKGKFYNIKPLSKFANYYKNRFELVQNENSEILNFDIYINNRNNFTIDFSQKFLYLVSCMKINKLFKNFKSWNHPQVKTLFCYRKNLNMCLKNTLDKKGQKPPFTLIWVTNIF